MRARKNFWDRNAGLYDCFMRKDRAVYEKMYELIRPVKSPHRKPRRSATF